MGKVLVDVQKGCKTCVPIGMTKNPMGWNRLYAHLWKQGLIYINPPYGEKGYDFNPVETWVINILDAIDRKYEKLHPDRIIWGKHIVPGLKKDLGIQFPIKYDQNLKDKTPHHTDQWFEGFWKYGGTYFKGRKDEFYGPTTNIFVYVHGTMDPINLKKKSTIEQNDLNDNHGYYTVIRNVSLREYYDKDTKNFSGKVIRLIRGDIIIINKVINDVVDKNEQVVDQLGEVSDYWKFSKGSGFQDVPYFYYYIQTKVKGENWVEPTYWNFSTYGIQNLTETYEVIKNQHGCVIDQDQSFFWNGMNNIEERRKAGKALISGGVDNREGFENLGLIESYNHYKRYKVQFHLIGHSHGGNVILEALKHAKSTQWPTNWKIRSLSFLSTPYLENIHSLNFNASEYSNVIDWKNLKVMNISNNYDLTQGFLASFNLNSFNVDWDKFAELKKNISFDNLVGDVGILTLTSLEGVLLGYHSNSVKNGQFNVPSNIDSGIRLINIFIGMLKKIEINIPLIRKLIEELFQDQNGSSSGMNQFFTKLDELAAYFGTWVILSLDNLEKLRGRSSFKLSTVFFAMNPLLSGLFYFIQSQQFWKSDDTLFVDNSEFVKTYNDYRLKFEGINLKSVFEEMVSGLLGQIDLFEPTQRTPLASMNIRKDQEKFEEIKSKDKFHARGVKYKKIDEFYNLLEEFKSDFKTARTNNNLEEQSKQLGKVLEILVFQVLDPIKSEGVKYAMEILKWLNDNVEGIEKIQFEYLRQCIKFVQEKQLELDYKLGGHLPALFTNSHSLSHAKLYKKMKTELEEILK